MLAHIELPLWLSFVGVPILSLLGTWLTHLFFGVPFGLALLSLPLIFVLTLICTNAMALTCQWVEGVEPICAGLITGAALLGIANALVNVLFFS